MGQCVQATYLISCCLSDFPVFPPSFTFLTCTYTRLCEKASDQGCSRKMDDSSTSGGLKSLSSVALWPFLMNLPFLAQFLPWEGIASQLDVTSLVQAVLRTSIGYYLSGILLCFGLIHLLYTIWKLARAAVLATWQVKCSIPQESGHQRRVMAWVSKHPEAQSSMSFSIPAVCLPYQWHKVTI